MDSYLLVKTLHSALQDIKITMETAQNHLKLPNRRWRRASRNIQRGLRNYGWRGNFVDLPGRALHAIGTVTLQTIHFLNASAC